MKRLLDLTMRWSISLCLLSTSLVNLPTPVFAQQAECTVTTPRYENGNLVVIIETDDGIQTFGYIAEEQFADEEILASNEQIGLGVKVFTFSADSLPEGNNNLKFYAHINGFSCANSGVGIGSSSNPPNPPSNEPPPEQPPDDSEGFKIANEKYEAARLATEQARINADCVEKKSDEAMRALRLADPQGAALAHHDAQNCARALDENLDVIHDAHNYWSALDSSNVLTGDAATKMDNLDRWNGEVNGLNTSADAIDSEASKLMSKCAHAQSTIACSQNPDNYDDDNYNPGGSQGGAGGPQNNACFNDRIDPFIYNSAECQNQRANNQEELDPEQLAMAECDERKPEGAVWVVFASQCVTFVEFGPIIISYLLTFSSIIAGVMFVVASFKYLSSKGDPSALADARDMMINAAVGMVLIASAYAIVVVLNDAFGFAGGAINLLPFFEFNPI